MTWLVIGSTLVVIVILFGWASRSYTRALFRAAEQAEKAGRFEDAVYFYGEALYHHHRRADICRDKIRSLWAVHGPFTFSADRAGFAKRSDQDKEGDLEMFEDVVRVIQQVTSGKLERRHYEG